MKSVKPSFDFWACVLALGLLLSLALAMHALSYREPYERDECVYAVVGREILRGRGLYTDVWDIKPPGIFLTYAAAIALFGYGRPPIFFLAVFADALTILGLFAAVKAATGNRLAALWCAALWTIVACSAELQANQPNSEVFLNALAIWAIWALFKGQTVEGSRQERLWLLGMGALWAIASYFKQVAVVPGLLFAVFAGIRWAGGRPKWSPGRSFLAIAPILGLWAVTALFFYVRGAWWDFVYVNFTFLRLYGHGFTWMEKQPFLFKVLPARVYFLWPLAVLNLAGLWAGLRARNRVWLAWALLCLGAEIEIYLPGQFFGHYYQLLVVPLALGAGLALDQLSEIKFMKRIPLWNSLAAVALLILAANEWPFWRLSPEGLSSNKYGSLFISAHDDAEVVGALLQPREGLYVYAGEPEYYFWAKKSPPSGMVTGTYDETPNVPVLIGRTVASLRRDPPQLVIVDDTFPVTAISDYIRAHYVVVRRFGNFTYLALDHGSLLRRLEG